MFKFFNGTVDQLLAQSEENAKHIDRLFNPKARLTHDEGVEYLMDALKIPRETAEGLLVEWELEELNKTFLSLEGKRDSSS